MTSQPFGWPLLQKPNGNMCPGNGEQRTTIFSIGNINRNTHYGEESKSSWELNLVLPYDWVVLYLYVLKKVKVKQFKVKGSKMCLHSPVHCNIVHNCQDMGEKHYSSSMGRLVKKMWYMLTMECYLTVKDGDLLVVLCDSILGETSRLLLTPDRGEQIQIKTPKSSLMNWRVCWGTYRNLYEGLLTGVEITQGPLC